MKVLYQADNDLRKPGEGRILVSHDFETMPNHFRQFTHVRPSPGVLSIRQDVPVGDAIESLLLI